MDLINSCLGIMLISYDTIQNSMISCDSNQPFLHNIEHHTYMDYRNMLLRKEAIMFKKACQIPIAFGQRLTMLCVRRLL